MEIFVAILVLAFLGLFALLSMPLSKEDRQLIDMPDERSTRPTR